MNAKASTDEVLSANGLVSSSKCPPFQYIPLCALISLAERCQKGVDIKKDKAWNALSKNQDVLSDVEYCIQRLDHVVKHAYILMEKLSAGDVKALVEDDDAGAIMWGGMFASCVVKRMLEGAGREPECEDSFAHAYAKIREGEEPGLYAKVKLPGGREVIERISATELEPIRLSGRPQLRIGNCVFLLPRAYATTNGAWYVTIGDHGSFAVAQEDGTLQGPIYGPIAWPSEENYGAPCGRIDRQGLYFRVSRAGRGFDIIHPDSWVCDPAYQYYGPIEIL